MLRAVVADPDMPARYAMQVQHELDLAEAGATSAGETVEAAAIDVDAIIEQLFRDQGAAVGAA